MESNDILALVFARNAFYKRLHYFALGIFFLCLVLIGLLTSVLLYIKNNPPKPLFFATDTVGKLIPIIPVDQPNMTDQEAAKWTINALQKTFSYDYVNYHAQLQATQRYFTTYGWTNYMKSLMASNNLLALTQRQMIVMAQVVDQPQLITKGILGGRYAWKFQLPLLATYWLPPFNNQSKFLNPLQSTVIIRREPVLQSDHGVGIVQLIADIPSSSQIATRTESSV